MYNNKQAVHVIARIGTAKYVREKAAFRNQDLHMTRAQYGFYQCMAGRLRDYVTTIDWSLNKTITIRTLNRNGKMLQ